MTDENPSSKTENDRFSGTERRRIVRDRYADIATEPKTVRDDSDPGDTVSDTSCCSNSDQDDETYDEQSRLVGYSDEEIGTVEPGANLGLGCGNPTAIASLRAGETVVDLGSGAGFDCFLAAQEVGSDGRVIGVDMTPEMIETARENVHENDVTNVEFRLGEIEHLPVADESVDVIISNCVVNLSPAKYQVFDEAFRVLRPGGRLAISDVVQTAQIPEVVQTDPRSLSACVSGASPIDELESILADVGFESISIDPKADSDEFIREWDDERDLSEYLVSATIEGRKPER